MDIDPTVVLIGGIITWRLSMMMVRETGPFAVFAKSRAMAAKASSEPGGLYELVSCISCSSVYIGLVAALFIAESLVGIFLYTLSFSAIAIITERLTTRKE